jgi:hypothetical protein
VIIGEEDLNGVGWDGDEFVLVGAEGLIATSADLGTWTRQEGGTRVPLTDVVGTDDTIVAVGYDSSDSGRAATVLYSQDRRHWTHIPSPGRELRRVVSDGNGVLVLGGDRTLIQADCADGPLIELEPPYLELLWHEQYHLSLRVREGSAKAVDVTIRSSDPAALTLPSTVRLPASGGPITIPVVGETIADGVWVTVELPDELGGRSSVTRIDVVPPLPDPHRVMGRIGRRP